jgi:hypothetical protein
MNSLQQSDRFVGYFDILGFRNAIYRRGITSLTEVYSEAIELMHQTQIAKFEIVGPAQSTGQIMKWFEKIDHVTIFSDSIFVFSKDSSPVSFTAMCQFSNTIFRHFFRRMLPLRGAIVHGDVVLDAKKNLFLGDGIIMAYELAESLNALGVVLSPDLPVPVPSLLALDCEVRRKDGTLTLKIPVTGMSEKTTIPEQWPDIFRSLRKEAGPAMLQRYVNSEKIVALMLNIDAEDLK